MEMNMAKFSEKLVELLELAKKKKNVLEYQEISDFFKDSPLEVDQMEKVFDFLEASGVDVLRITDNSGDELLLDNDMDMDGMEDAEKCMEAGMNAHLAKPLDDKTIKQTICEELRSSRDR